MRAFQTFTSYSLLEEFPILCHHSCFSPTNTAFQHYRALTLFFRRIRFFFFSLKFIYYLHNVICVTVKCLKILSLLSFFPPSSHSPPSSLLTTHTSTWGILTDLTIIFQIHPCTNCYFYKHLTNLADEGRK